MGCGTDVCCFLQANLEVQSDGTKRIRRS
jgi:hypothetical protein